MDAVNLVIGVVLFVVTMIVLVANTQRVNDLKKSIRTQPIASSASASHGLFLRDGNGNYVPKKPYYLHVINSSTSLTLPTKDDSHAQVIIQTSNTDDSQALFNDLKNLKVKVVYRPEKRVLYKVKKAFFGSTDEIYNDTMTAMSTSSATFTSNSLIVLHLVRNSETSSNSDMYDSSEIVQDQRRTIVGIPASMGSMNSATGI